MLHPRERQGFTGIFSTNILTPEFNPGGARSLLLDQSVRPDMQYCSRSRCFYPDPGTKHISVLPRHMTMPYAPDFQHDVTTLQIQGYNISYNRHKTSLIQYNSGRYMSEYRLQSKPSGKEKNIDPITTRV